MACHRRPAGPVEIRDADLLVGQRDYLLPGHLGPCWESTALELRDLLLAARGDLFAARGNVRTYFWVRQGPRPPRTRSPLVWMVLWRPRSRGRVPAVCFDHGTPAILVVEVRRGVCPEPLYGACGRDDCYESAIDQALRAVIVRLASADRSPHVPRRHRS